MQQQFSKIDIGSIKRKPKAEEKSPKRIIRREVLTMELVMPLRRARQKQARDLLAYTKFSAPKKHKPDLVKQFRQVGSFAMVGLSLLFVLQGLVYASSARKASGEILGEATSAYTDLHTAGQNLGSQNFAAAGQLFNAASANIKSAQDKLNDFRALTWLMPQANSAQHVLTGAGFLAQAGDKLASSLVLFDQLKVTSKGVETDNFNDKIKTNRELLAASLQLTREASDEFNSADSLPLDYAGTLDAAKLQVSQLSAILQKLIGLENLYLDFFSGQKNYLLVFQNSDELRATGGFIGTYGILKTDNGKITKLDIQSIYQLDGQIFNQIAAPGPFQPNIQKWGIRDANWFADFPTSAQKLLRFLESGLMTADGVISVTPQLFENILKLTGPIEMPDYGVTLTPENFQQVVQFKTSVDYDKTLNQPKKFLADFAPILLNKLAGLGKDKWIELFQDVETSLQGKQLLLYSKDQAVQQRIGDLGFAGSILPTDYDYLDIVNSNLGGTKTDLNMDQKASLQSKILSDGTVIDTLTVTRKNSATASNKDYLRVLTPLGSQLVSATGFDNYQYFPSQAPGLITDPDLALWDKGQMQGNVYERTESNKTEFAGWLATDPGIAKTVTLTYVLPTNALAGSGYSLLLQKQAGAKAYEFNGSIDLGFLHTSWLSDNMRNTNNKLNFQSNSNFDDFFAAVLSP